MMSVFYVDVIKSYCKVFNVPKMCLCFFSETNGTRASFYHAIRLLTYRHRRFFFQLAAAARNAAI